MPISEEDMARFAMEIAAGNQNGEVTYDELRRRIPTMTTLDAADLSQSQVRDKEPMWHQIFRNIKSHSKSPGNAIFDGRLEHVPDTGYRITSHGRAWLATYLNGI